jgi:hypothetical protein
MRAKCASCPFRKEGYTEVAELLVSRALTEATPICHSTGDSTIVPVSKKITRKNLACRGARDVQLRYFASLGFISEATDKAWNQRCKQFGLPCLPTVTKELLLDWEDTHKQYSP